MALQHILHQIVVGILKKLRKIYSLLNTDQMCQNKRTATKLTQLKGGV